MISVCVYMFSQRAKTTSAVGGIAHFLSCVKYGRLFVCLLDDCFFCLFIYWFYVWLVFYSYHVSFTYLSFFFSFSLISLFSSVPLPPFLSFSPPHSSPSRFSPFLSAYTSLPPSFFSSSLPYSFSFCRCVSPWGGGVISRRRVTASLQASISPLAD